MEAAIAGIVGTALGAAIGFAGQVVLARQRAGTERSVRVEERQRSLYEEMLAFVYDYERIVHRAIVNSDSRAKDEDLAALVVPLRVKLRLHASPAVRSAFSAWVTSWVKYHERLNDEGEPIYAMPNDGSRDVPLRELRARLHAELIDPHIKALEDAAAQDLVEQN